MRRCTQVMGCLLALCLMAGLALAEGTCSKCGEKIESPRWNFCPHCGLKLDKSVAGAPAAAPSPRDAYEPVSWDKIVFEKDKYHDKKVTFTARFTGIGHHFAPAEVLGITQANFINFSFQGNRTNYIDMKKRELVEKLNRLQPYTTIVIYAQIKVRKDVYNRGQDVYVVLVDDLDVK